MAVRASVPAADDRCGLGDLHVPLYDRFAGLLGKTFGMRIFSLELIDADANVYPTTHQAAVSSAVYLLSMAFGGLGFLTVLFNEEKRAVHDIVSGTLLIRDI